MCKCIICGSETAKDRKVCKGCHSLKKFARNKEKTPKIVVENATKHLEKNPGLLEISWKSFWKKNTKTIV
jgi:hypothetical protein